MCLHVVFCAVTLFYVFTCCILCCDIVLYVYMLCFCCSTALCLFCFLVVVCLLLHSLCELRLFKTYKLREGDSTLKLTCSICIALHIHTCMYVHYIYVYVYVCLHIYIFVTTQTLLVKMHILVRHVNHYSIVLNNTVDIVTMEVIQQSSNT